MTCNLFPSNGVKAADDLFPSGADCAPAQPVGKIGAISCLLDRLHRIFDKDAKQELALILRYDGDMLWAVHEGSLITNVVGGTGESLNIPLPSHTIASLADAIERNPGYSVPWQSSDLGSRSAMALLDSTGDQDKSNGDHIYAYTSLLWVILKAFESALSAAYWQIIEAVKQVHLHLASGDYADTHGDYYGIMRVASELDTDYRDRIIAYVLMARNNNIAIQLAIAKHLVIDPSEVAVIDADTQVYGDVLRFDGTWAFNGSKSFNGRTISGDLSASRAQFSVVLPESVATILSRTEMVEVINKYKAAGTRLLDIYRGRPLVFDGTWAFDGLEQFNGRIVE